MSSPFWRVAASREALRNPAPAFAPSPPEPGPSDAAGASAFVQRHEGIARFWYIGVVVACVIGSGLVLGATSRGVGLSPDSVQYLAAAKNATEGRGLITYAWEGEPTPLTHFPPAYPLVLTGAAHLGWSGAGFARWFNVGLFIVTIVIAVAMTRRLIPQSPWPALTTAVLYAAAHDLVVAHSMAWTEPLYLTLTLLGCLTLAHALDRRALRFLYAAAALAGISATVRYVGVANIGVVAVAVILWWTGSWWRRTRVAALTSIVGGVPLLAVLVLTGTGAGEASAGGLANRQIGWHPVNAADLRLLVSVVGKWVSPLSDATYLTGIWLIGLGVLIGVAIVARWRSVEWRRNTNHLGEAASRTPTLARVLFLYIAAYFSVLALSMSLADAQTEFDSRLLVPVLGVALVLGVVALAWVGRGARDVRLAAHAILALILVAELSRVLPWAREARRYGLGLRRLDSTDRQIVAATRHLPQTARVYSNRPYFLRVQTSRMVPGLPRQRDPNSLLPNPNYRQQVRAMCDENARTHETFVILFPDSESEDPTVNKEVAVTNGDVSVLRGGRVIKMRPGCGS